MMHYKRSIIDMLKDVMPNIDDNQGRRQTIVEECYERWINGAKGRKENSE